MKTNELEKMLLLRQSSELSSQERKRLDAMLAADPASREEARKVDALRDAWQKATEETPLPSPSVMQRIRQAAEAGKNSASGTTGRLIPFALQPFGIAMAAAAAVLALSSTLILTILPKTESKPDRIAAADPIDTAIEAALEAIDTSMLVLLDEPSDEYEALLSNDS